MVTVTCPLCGETLEVTEWDAVTKTDVLVGHIAVEHGSKVRPSTPDEGPPLPRVLHIRWPWRR